MANKYYSPEIKERARLLRIKGLSLKDIAKELNLYKSTVRTWTLGVQMSPTAKKRLYTKSLLKMTTDAHNQRNRRLREIEKIILTAKEEINEPINDSAFKLLGAMIYWAEGAKEGQIIITNSDPYLIKFMVEWMRKVFNVDYANMKANLNIYPQQNDNEIKEFWSDLTGIPMINFNKSFIKPINKNYKKNTLYYGTIQVRLSKSGNNLHRTFGWVRKLLENMNINTELIQTRWNSLRTEYGRQIQILLPKNRKI